MKKFLLTSTAWDGEIEIEYNDFQLLVKCDTSRAELSEGQQLWFLKNLPREHSELKTLIDKTTTATLTEVLLEVTFDLFWNRYGEKIRSSKKRTLAKWNKMTEAERGKAYRFISKYEGNMQPGTNKKYAETYLNDELWNN